MRAELRVRAKSNLQGGLYLCQADQGAGHLQISGYLRIPDYVHVQFVGGCFGKYSKSSDLGDAVAGDLVGFFCNSAAASFHLLCRPGKDMPDQIFSGGMEWFGNH